MKQIIATAILSLFLYTIIPTVTSQCYGKNDCINDETDAIQEAGDTWEASNCYHCTCSSYTITVKTCVEPYGAEKDNFEVKKSGSDLQKPVEIEVNSTTESDDIQCPDIVIDFIGKEVPVFPPVKYVNYVKTVFYSGCCRRTLSYTLISPNCMKLVDPNDPCKVRVVDKETGGPCTSPVSAVGK